MLLFYTLKRQTEQRELTAAQLIAIAEQMLTIEDRIKMEEEAKEAQTIGSNQYTKRLTPALEEGTVVKSSKEVAKQLAEKAGVDKRTIYFRTLN